VRKEVPAAKNILAVLKANLCTVIKEFPILKNILATLKANINAPEKERFFKKGVEEE
jgi:hypothetical protein